MAGQGSQSRSLSFCTVRERARRFMQRTWLREVTHRDRSAAPFPKCTRGTAAARPFLSFLSTSPFETVAFCAPRSVNESEHISVDGNRKCPKRVL
uniref:Uncharacterized protein n=1 Tax=Steinernema glaseri TaxID=37863 RepID=A0A1I7YJ33_9BILA